MPAAPKTGPVVVAENALHALQSIRHEWLLPAMFGRISITQEVGASLGTDWEPHREWMDIHPPVEVELPSRLFHVKGTDRATIQLAMALDSSLLLLDGKARLEKVKLSFIKAMGTIPLLVQAYQQDRIKSVRPLLTALERKGHDMLPPEQMQALLHALDEMES